MDYGRKVRVMRAARGLAQTDLAFISGVSNYYLSLIETGKMLPTEEWDAAIRLALGWPVNADEAFAILEQVPVSMAVPTAQQEVNA
jgi:transcriptional regulator with XRE-family HTH domain